MKKRLIKGLSLVVLSTTLISSATPSLSVVANTHQASSRPGKVTQNGVRLYIHEGRLYELPANASEPTKAELKAMAYQRGKWSIAVKAIRKGYSRVPSSVRTAINKYIGLNALLGTLEHYTGWIEDGIYNICRRAGMPHWLAWNVAKALTLIAL